MMNGRKKKITWIVSGLTLSVLISTSFAKATDEDQGRLKMLNVGIKLIKEMGGETAALEEEYQHIHQTFKTKGIAAARLLREETLFKVEEEVLKLGYGVNPSVKIKPRRKRPRVILHDDWVKRNTPIEELKKSLDHPHNKKITGDHMKWSSRAVGLAMLYRREGKKEYAQRAYKAIVYAGSLSVDEITKKYGASSDLFIGTYLKNSAIVYDTCYDILTQQQKQTLAERMNYFADMRYLAFLLGESYTDFNNHKHVGISGIGMAGLALLGDHPRADRYASFAAACYRKRIFPAWDLAGEDGGWHEGLSYANMTLGASYLFFTAWENMTGGSLWQESNFLKNFPKFLVYHASMNGYLEPFADSMFMEESDRVETDAYFAAELGKIYNNPWGGVAAQILLQPHNRVTEKTVMTRALFGSRDQVIRRALGDVEGLSWLKAQQPSFHFRGIGRVVGRDSWNQGALRFTFACGDYFGGHDHLDVGHFSIYGLDGGYALESGHYDEFGSDHWQEHFRRTVAHNTIALIPRSGTKIEGWKQMVLDDGGQPPPAYEDRPKSKTQWLKRKGESDRGDITHFEDHGSFMWTRCEGHPAYAGKLNRFSRTMILVRSDEEQEAAIIIEDKIKTSKSERVRWMMHPGKGYTRKGNSLQWEKMQLTFLSPQEIEGIRHDKENTHPPKKKRRIDSVLPDGRLEWILPESSGLQQVIAVFHSPKDLVSLSEVGKVTVGKRTVYVG